jgi:hypothetical protein
VPKIDQKKAQLPLIFTREQTIPAFSPPNCQIGVPKGLIPSNIGNVYQTIIRMTAQVILRILLQTIPEVLSGD